jgi:hypothetical protein
MAPPSTTMFAQQKGMDGGQSAGLPHVSALPTEQALEQVKGGLPPEALSLQQTFPTTTAPASPPPSLPPSLPASPTVVPLSLPASLPASRLPPSDPPPQGVQKTFGGPASPGLPASWLPPEQAPLTQLWPVLH